MYRQEEPEVNFEKVFARFKGIFGFLGGSGKGFGPILILVIIVIGVGFWVASGLFSVQPGEQAALKMFGK